MKYLVSHKITPPSQYDEVFVDLYNTREEADAMANNLKKRPNYKVDILELEDAVIDAMNATLNQPKPGYGVDPNYRLRPRSEIETFKQIKNGKMDLSVLQPLPSKVRIQLELTSVTEPREQTKNGEKQLSVLQPLSPKKRKREENKEEQQDLSKVAIISRSPETYTKARAAFFLGLHPRLGRKGQGTAISPLLQAEMRASHFERRVFELAVNLAIPRDPAKKAAEKLETLIRQKYNILYTSVQLSTDPITIKIKFEKSNLVHSRCEADKAIEQLTAIGGIRVIGNNWWNWEMSVTLTLEQCNSAIRMFELLSTPTAEETAAINSARSMGNKQRC